MMSVKKSMKCAVIYTRVSTKEQTTNLSLSLQEKTCREYCAREGVEVIRLFVDAGESAKTTDRPEFQNMLAFCREKKKQLHHVVVYNMTRFSRDTYDHAVVKALLAKFLITLRSATEPIDDTPVGKMTENLLAVLSQFDNDVRSDRTVEGMKATIEAGRWPFQAPLGYLNSPESSSKGLLIHDPERASLVREAFQLYGTGRFHTR